MYRQTELKSLGLHDEDYRMTAWLRDEPGLKVGALVTLVGDTRTWEVLRLSHLRLPAPPEAKWKVGGLL
jgi:hypothetical protein